jgi:uridine phosphorylase
VVGTLGQFQPLLEAGALIVVDEARARARILPLSRT